MRLTDRQVDFAVRCVEEWLMVRNREGKERVGPSDPGHSELLPRLLRGDRPHESPPPLCFSRPCYDLAEGRPVRAEVFDSGDAGFGIVVNQHGGWRWEDDGVLLYEATGLRCRATRIAEEGMRQWELRRIDEVSPLPDTERSEP